MRSENYRDYFKSSFMMGPNCLRLLDEIPEEYRKRFANGNMKRYLPFVLCGSIKIGGEMVYIMI